MPAASKFERMRILVTGAGGMVGRALVHALEPRHDVRGYRHEQLDVTRGDAVEQAIAEYRPHAVAHLGAWTDVDGCELDPERAMRVNAEGTRRVAESARKHRARMLYVSTDYVFDGTASRPIPEDAAPHPINTYGRSKLEGERAVQSLLTEYFIVRSSWIYGAGGRNFVDTVLRLAEERDRIEMVEDQVGCPTYALDLAAALVVVLESRAYGLYHITNDTEATWYLLAQQVLRTIGSDVLLIPVKTEQVPRPARRPLYSALGNYRLHHILDYRMRPWRGAVRSYLEERRPA